MADTGKWLFPALFFSSLLCIVVTLLSLTSGLFIIFQNLYYVPIVIACIYYTWRGFGFSVFLAGLYFLLFISFTNDPVLIQEAAIRVLIFSGIAWVITVLSVLRMKTEIAHRESEERYRNVVENQTEFICRFLPDGTHVFVNEAYCRYFGLERDEVIGSRFKPRIHPEDIDKVSRLVTSLTPDCPSGTIVQRTFMQDGTLFWQRWNTRAIFDENGVLREFQSVGRDITLQKEAEAKLRRTKEYLEKLHLSDLKLHLA